MSESAVRRSGLAGIFAAGVMIVLAGPEGPIVEVLGIERAVPALEAIMYLLLIPAFLGMRSAQTGRDGALGRVGLVIVVSGLAFHAIEASIGTVFITVLGRPPDVEKLPGLLRPVFEISAGIGELGFQLGLVVFAVAAIRGKVLPRWGAVLLLGLPLVLVIVIATGAIFGTLEEGPGPFVFVGPLLTAIGLLWIGYVLRSGSWVGGPASPTLPRQAPRVSR